MPATEIYDTEPYCREITTRIINCQRSESGYLVSLANTILYPGGGGQAPDRGWINGIPVIETVLNNNVVWYRIARPADNGIKLKLDWEFRYRNMQQHTGQHILSAVLARKFKIQTVSVHLGKENTMIELDKNDLRESEIEQGEDIANQVIRDNLPVQAVLVDRTDLNKYNVRRDVKVNTDPVRLIRIGDYDCTGCGGTHVASTGEVGLIKVVKKEKIRNHTRLAVKIGQPAYKHYADLNQRVQDLTRILSCGTNELPERVANLIEESQLARREIKELTTKWLTEYIRMFEPKISGGTFILTELNMEELAIFSKLWVNQYRLPCFVATEHSGKKHFVFRVPTGVSSGADTFIRSVAQEFGLRGGGNEELVRGVIVYDSLTVSYQEHLEEKLRLFYS